MYLKKEDMIFYTNVLPNDKITKRHSTIKLDIQIIENHEFSCYFFY